MPRARRRQVVGSRLVTHRFVGRFQELADQADSVWLATAWITRSKALDSLLTLGRSVKAVAGIHGCATDPDAIQSLIDSGCGVRIVEGGALFHPKLYLFRRRNGRTKGWIGSANFTGAGLAGNREVILEFDDGGAIAELESWFEAQWGALAGQDVQAVLDDYRRDRDNVAPALGSIVDSRDHDLPRPMPRATGEKPRYVYGFLGVECGAKSYARIVQEVLTAFHDMDGGFLERFGRWDEGRGLKRYVAKTVAELQLSDGAAGIPLPNGWKLANKFEDYHHFFGLTDKTGMLRKACELVQLPGGPTSVQYKGHVCQVRGLPAQRPPELVAEIGQRHQERTYWQ